MTRGLRTALMVVVMLMAHGCKSRGTVGITLDVPPACEGANRVRPYLLRGVACSECACGDCVAACRADNCSVGCVDASCPIDSLDDGLAIEPPGAGVYAAVLQLYERGTDGVDHLIASVCQDVEIQADGTASKAFDVSAQCCPVTP